MKASIKFREERNPLFRAKFPLKVGGLPFSSGITVGSSQELSVHVGTFFHIGPSVKVAFKPNDGGNPLSVVLKMGFGQWASPQGAAMTLRAEFLISSKGRDPIFTLSLKPRLGDFSLQKHFSRLKLPHRNDMVAQDAGVTSHFDIANDKQDVLTPRGDSKLFSRHTNGNLTEKDRARSPSVDSVVIGSNFSLKIEGLEKEWKGKHEKKQKAEGVKELYNGVGKTMNGNGNLIDVQNGFLKGQDRTDDDGKQSSTLLFAGVCNQLQGSKFLTHSKFPLGTKAQLNIRWGAKSLEDIFHSWDGSLPTLLSSCRIPSLIIDKLSFEQMPQVEKPRTSSLDRGFIGGGLLPAGFPEDNEELAQVVLLCSNMKRQMQLLQMENHVLRNSMEDMRSKVEVRGYNYVNKGSDCGASSKSHPPTRSFSELDGSWMAQNGREEDSGKDNTGII
ncbi:hypothetical protein KP509_09G095100 [Ceratopteris richardii]|uniref:Uncharacterized protein n=1 Tax=Ceratopteris richardii TaxID=49495 RepID=A0A8T2U4V5_CERRI|nr:hypothetical protein KP509_09G095100 [Ceratopteris richardii]KAH7430353.1 hypothetical protein KP509_09G095100 [Ceratopteris richardii]